MSSNLYEIKEIVPASNGIGLYTYNGDTGVKNVFNSIVSADPRLEDALFQPSNIEDVLILDTAHFCKITGLTDQDIVPFLKRAEQLTDATPVSLGF